MFEIIFLPGCRRVRSSSCVSITGLFTQFLVGLRRGVQVVPGVECTLLLETFLLGDLSSSTSSIVVTVLAETESGDINLGFARLLTLFDHDISLFFCSFIKKLLDSSSN